MATQAIRETSPDLITHDQLSPMRRELHKRHGLSSSSSDLNENIASNSSPVPEQEKSAEKTSCCGSRVIKYGLPIAITATVGAGYLASRTSVISLNQ